MVKHCASREGKKRKGHTAVNCVGLEEYIMTLMYYASVSCEMARVLKKCFCHKLRKERKNCSANVLAVCLSDINDGVIIMFEKGK